MNQPETATHTYTPLAATFCNQCADHYALDPDELRAPGTDDEPWVEPPCTCEACQPGPDPDARRWWALAIAMLVLAVVAVVWWR